MNGKLHFVIKTGASDHVDTETFQHPMAALCKAYLQHKLKSSILTEFDLPFTTVCTVYVLSKNHRVYGIQREKQLSQQYCKGFV